MEFDASQPDVPHRSSLKSKRSKSNSRGVAVGFAVSEVPSGRTPDAATEPPSARSGRSQSNPRRRHGRNASFSDRLAKALDDLEKWNAMT